MITCEYGFDDEPPCGERAVWAAAPPQGGYTVKLCDEHAKDHDLDDLEDLQSVEV